MRSLLGKSEKISRSSSDRAIAGLIALALVLAWPAAALAGRVENPLFGYTHMLPSPFTVPAGRLVLGTDVALGVTDFLQVGSNILRDAFQFYNANAKLSLLDFPEAAVGAFVGFETFNYRDFNASNPDLRVTSWQPGLVTAFALHPQLAWFMGGNLNLSKITLDTAGLQTSGYLRGATLESDLSWAYNPHKKSLGNVLAVGATYDLTYKIYGVGVSHYWRGFHIGVHYYPNATDQKVQPILSGGAAVDL